MYSFSLLSGISFDHISNDIDLILGSKPSVAESREALREIFSFMDFTSLEGSDNPAKIQLFCEKAISFGDKGLPFPAAVCIYPPFISVAKHALRGTPIKVATTAAAFPSGQMPLSVKLEEIRYAIGEGADEIDVVISVGKFLAGDYMAVLNELILIREATAGVTLKVILETGLLKTAANMVTPNRLSRRVSSRISPTSCSSFPPPAARYHAGHRPPPAMGCGTGLPERAAVRQRTGGCLPPRLPRSNQSIGLAPR